MEETVKNKILSHPNVEQELNNQIRSEFNDFIKEGSRSDQIEFLKSRHIDLEDDDPDTIESELDQDLSLLMNEDPDAKLDFLISRGIDPADVLESMND